MNSFADHFEQRALRLQRYLRNEAVLVTSLALLALAAYGFELFNLNLTIDDEVWAFMPDRRLYIEHGRWGLYLLDRFVLPYPVIAFVPLFIALVCHVGAMLLLLQSWRVESPAERFLAGAVGVAFPGMAYCFAFSMSSYAIGIGQLCCALSLFIFARSAGWQRLWAMIPVVIALSIYQAFVVVIATVFLLAILLSILRGESRAAVIRDALQWALICIVSCVIYGSVTAVVLGASGTTISYVDRILSLDYLRTEPLAVIARMLRMMRDIYGGVETVYASSDYAFPVVVALALGGTVFAIARSAYSWRRRCIATMLVAAVVLLPFPVVLFMAGAPPVRFLVALPAVTAGLIVLGMRAQSRGFRLLLAACGCFCVFQFVVSINYLNASSHLALQADRLLASQVVARIEGARIAAGLAQPKYIELVGYWPRPASRLMPKAETFGASFFEWELGNAQRVIYFLRTLGYYQGVEVTPAAQRAGLAGMVAMMPAWPADGSVKAAGEAIVIKFGDYSEFQRQAICKATSDLVWCGLRQ